jgi:hypothetical protein
MFPHVTEKAPSSAGLQPDLQPACLPRITFTLHKSSFQNLCQGNLTYKVMLLLMDGYSTEII